MLSNMESEKPMTDALSASQALEDARAARALVGARLDCPRYMHFVLAGLMSAMIASQSLSTPWNVPAVILCLVAVLMLMQYQRKRYGFFVNGYRKGRTRVVAISLLLFVEVVLFGSIWLKLVHHVAWAPLAGGILVFPVTILASYRWQAAYKADLAQVGG